MPEFSLIGIIGKPELDLTEINKYLDNGVNVFMSDLKKFDTKVVEVSYKHLVEDYLVDVSEGKFSDGHENAIYSPYMGMLVAKMLSKIIKSDLTDTDAIGGILFASIDKVVFKYIATKIITGLHVANCI